ncbi:hypothetical protein, partial [Burkholderia vietnamiensis]|uniref:hypothetical protein n=1 Tax=Burkholderia vietnamiensis TaxID=60552 RepID=UPI001B98D536
QTYPSPTFSSLTLQNPLTVANGGTGAATSTAARASLGAASSGSNSDITNLVGTMHSPTSAPSSTCNSGSYTGAFNCDLSQVSNAIGSNITGAATLGQPATGYLITPNMHSVYAYYSSFSGWNQSTDGNGGRTGNGAFYVKVDNYGQGDAWGAFYNVFVDGAKAGATSWLANPAGAMIAGQNFAGANGVYLQGIGDINLNDNGFDVTGIAEVLNLNRTVNTAALGETWIGSRIQSTGSTKNVDAFYSAVGPSTIGLDLSGMTGGNIGIALPPNVGIYGDVTNTGSFPNTITPGGAAITYNSSASQWQIASGGVDALNISSNNVTSSEPVTVGASGNALNVTSTQASSSTTTGAITTAGGVGIGGAVYAGGLIVPASAVGIKGTTTNDNVQAGSVGEFPAVTNNSGISLVSSTPFNASSVSLTAGDWDVSGCIYYSLANSTVANFMAAGINTTSAALPDSPGPQIAFLSATQNTGPSSSYECSPVVRMSLASTTTVYLVGQLNFTTSTATANGYMRARRVR